MEFKIDKDVLDISDLLSGVMESGGTSGLISGGYLNFDAVANTDEGTTTIKMSIDTVGNPGVSASVSLAEVTMQGFSLGLDSSNFATEILSQLIHDEIKF